MKSFLHNIYPSKRYLEEHKMRNVKRNVLFHYNAEKNVIEVRNYYVKHSFTNLNNNIKKILNSNKIPDFSSMNDVSDLFVKNQAILSDSDIDHLPNSKLEVENKVLGKKEKYQINIRLYEIGPRLTL